MLKKEKKIKIIIVIILGSGFFLRIVSSFMFGDSPIWPDTDDYLVNADNILLGKELNCYRGILFSYFIALIFTVLPKSVISIRLVHAFLWVAIFYIYYYISLKIFKRKKIAIITIAILSLHPLLIYLSSVCLSETLFIFLYSIMLMVAYIYRKEKKILYILGVGIFWGMSFLVKSTVVLFIPILLVWVIFENKNDLKKNTQHTVCLIASFIIILLPYAIKMHNNLGGWGLHSYGTKFLWRSTVLPLYGKIGRIIINTDDMSKEQLEKILKYTPDLKEHYSFTKKNRMYKETIIKYIKENTQEYIFKLFSKFINNFTLTTQTDTKNSLTKTVVAIYLLPLSLGLVYFSFFIGLITLKTNILKMLPLLAVLIGSLTAFTIYMSRVRYTLSVFPVIIIFSAYGIDFLMNKGINIFKKRN